MYNRQTGHLQFLDKFLHVALGRLSDDIEHFFADGTDLTRLSIACGVRQLVALLLGETNAEYTEEVSISGADVNESLDKRLPLADKRAELITGHIHAVEVGQDIVSLNVLHDQADLSVSLGLITTVKVGEAGLEHTALKRVGGDFY